jgi:hypothetical protein
MMGRIGEPEDIANAVVREVSNPFAIGSRGVEGAVEHDVL